MTMMADHIVLSPSLYLVTSMLSVSVSVSCVFAALRCPALRCAMLCSHSPPCSAVLCCALQYVRQGGVQVAVEEKSQAEKLVDVALGKAKKGTLKEKTSESVQAEEAAKLAVLEK